MICLFSARSAGCTFESAGRKLPFAVLINISPGELPGDELAQCFFVAAIYAALGIAYILVQWFLVVDGKVQSYLVLTESLVYCRK